MRGELLALTIIVGGLSGFVLMFWLGASRTLRDTATAIRDLSLQLREAAYEEMRQHQEITSLQQRSMVAEKRVYELEREVQRLHDVQAEEHRREMLRRKRQQFHPRSVGRRPRIRS